MTAVDNVTTCHWLMPTRIMRQGGGGFFGGGDGIQAERSFCEVYEEGNVTNQLRH